MPSLRAAQSPDVLRCNDTLNGNNLRWKKDAEKYFLKGVSDFGGSAPTGQILTNYSSGTYQVLNRNQRGSLGCQEIWEPGFWSPMCTAGLPA